MYQDKKKYLWLMSSALPLVGTLGVLLFVAFKSAWLLVLPLFFIYVFIPVMDYVREHPTDALIYFTDLYASLDIESPGIPVLWVCNSSHEPAPFGETVYTDSAKDNP